MKSKLRRIGIIPICSLLVCALLSGCENTAVPVETTFEAPGTETAEPAEASGQPAQESAADVSTTSEAVTDAPLACGVIEPPESNPPETGTPEEEEPAPTSEQETVTEAPPAAVGVFTVARITDPEYGSGFSITVPQNAAVLIPLSSRTVRIRSDGSAHTLRLLTDFGKLDYALDAVGNLLISFSTNEQVYDLSWYSLEPPGGEIRKDTNLTGDLSLTTLIALP